MQPRDHIGVPGTKSRPKTNKDSGNDHRCQRVSKHLPIKAAIHSITEVRRRRHRTNERAARGEGPLSRKCSGDSAKDRNNQTLGKYLSDDPSIPRADGHSNRHLMLPAHGTCQQNTGTVHARKQKDQSGKGKEQGRNGRNKAGD